MLDPREVELTYAGGPWTYWNPGAATAPGRLGRAEADALRALTDKVYNGAPQLRRVRRVDLAWLPRGVVLCGSRADRTARIELSAPEFVGDVAFVSSGVECGGLCGEGLRFLLRRKHGSWKVEAVQTRWQS